jgi:hypothetical protein
LVVALAVLVITSSHLSADTGTCGGAIVTIPFTDVASNNTFFCAIAEAYFSGLTNGTSATTYSPTADVTREQMAAFITRTMDQSLKRGSRRAALDQYWTTQSVNHTTGSLIGSSPQLVQSDGADLWVANLGSDTVSRIRGSDGKPLLTWAGLDNATGVLCAMGKVFVAGQTNPGTLYQIDPAQPAAPVVTLSSALGGAPQMIAYDGRKIWTANAEGSVSIVTLNPTSVNNVTAGFNALVGIIYDGANIWVVDQVSATINKLRKLDSNGNILLSVDLGEAPLVPAFDGTNIWVPNLFSDTVSVVRATGGLAGTVIATLSGNGLDFPRAVAFDGERILVTSLVSVSLWKAADLTPIGSFPASGGVASGVCSDGLNFWIIISSSGTNRLVRF